MEETIEKLPEPAKEAKAPEEIMTNEELYLTALHIEQYRHATYEPDAYYLEGLKRDPDDIRINNAYGLLLLRRGKFEAAGRCFNRAVKRLTWKNPNPYDSETYYNLGLSLWYQGKIDEAYESFYKAYESFYKAIWSNEQQEMDYYYLAAITMIKGNYEEALDFVDKALTKNTRNVKARGLKTVLLRKGGNKDEAMQFIKENLTIDAFDFVSLHECGQNEIMGDEPYNYMETARYYAEWGCYAEAIDILRLCQKPYPMLKYEEAFYSGKLRDWQQVGKCIEAAESWPSECCFPNVLEDIEVLKFAIRHGEKSAKACYYLGNLYYDKKQYDDAVKLWEQSVKLDETFPTAYRNLAIAYYNKQSRVEDAKRYLEKAFALDPSDSRIFLELDQLYMKLSIPPEMRLLNYEKYKDTFTKRDDLFIEYVTLNNLVGEYQRAYDLMMSRKFHPWEGGEGKVTTQYVISLVEQAKQYIEHGEYALAINMLQKALAYPENLGEGKLEGSKNNDIHYYLGLAYERLKSDQKAVESFERAAKGSSDPGEAMFYYDQPADMILYQGLAKGKLGDTKEANRRFYKLIDYGEKHLFDESKVGYFAVSLPDMAVFKADYNRQNQIHCWYLIGLGNLGISNTGKAKEAFSKVLKMDTNHQKARMYSKDLRY